ncbi:hypothetical protein QBC33DRAFT_562822 [Phialemonium atrogriseum]|uniref:Uncharacterized protein n=1 Tax=Phialemonium atrogriseum TaxID=1093897 RepID=A0AAJ0BWR2_9PEZI|nr:uncharacterized protein QBC33DRAFT_562822 [Phialemonium atrogriseum]KAK1763491.1 hypothetical protein QBC33DRAFT_562822 [Phialemonium atrogriseum]
MAEGYLHDAIIFAAVTINYIAHPPTGELKDAAPPAPHEEEDISSGPLPRWLRSTLQRFQSSQFLMVAPKYDSRWDHKEWFVGVLDWLVVAIRKSVVEYHWSYDENNLLWPTSRHIVHARSCILAGSVFLEAAFTKVLQQNVMRVFPSHEPLTETMICRPVVEQINAANTRDYIVQVGGYGMSQYLLRRLDKLYPGSVPQLESNKCGLVTVYGAVARKLNDIATAAGVVPHPPMSVTNVKARTSFGIRTEEQIPGPKMMTWVIKMVTGPYPKHHIA